MWTRRALWVALPSIVLPLWAQEKEEKEEKQKQREQEQDDDLTQLHITVKTLGGKPIERASVIVRFVEGRSIARLGRQVRTSWEVRTNQEGAVKIPPVPRGKIMIQVIARGYQTYGQTHEVEEPERKIEIKLNPPQPQYSAH